MSFGYIEVTYIIRDQHENEFEVTGIRVGRFSVRKALDDHPPPIGMTEPEAVERPWRVDHLPTGLHVISFSNAEDAYAFADDISRFAKSDPASRDEKRAVAQLGPVVGRWVADLKRRLRSGEDPISFRAWVAERGEQWSPRGRKWRQIR